MTKIITIIGANLAGGRAAEALRQDGFDGRIVLIGEEKWRPYERPPLSKEMLWDSTKPPSNFFLHSENWYEENQIELRLGARAESIDLAGGGVKMASGELLRTDKILLATGGKARVLALEGADAPNVHHLRTKDDADRLSFDLKAGAHIVVIGMGVIGCEVAASARKMGCEVTVIEPAMMPMSRTIGAKFGQWLGDYHKAQGVRTYFGISPAKLELEEGIVRAVRCTDNTRIECDAIVVGIGIVPSVELAEKAGITIDNGIIVDQQCRTSHPHIYAVGDVANQPSFFGGRIRHETYQNAVDQAATAAQSMMGKGCDNLRPGGFWSDQYDLNIQAFGRLDNSLNVVMRGSLEENKFTAFFLADDVVSGVLTVNSPANMGVAKRMVERRVSVVSGKLEDVSLPLRNFLRA